MTRVSTLARANPFVLLAKRGNDLGTVGMRVTAAVGVGYGKLDPNMLRLAAVDRICDLCPKLTSSVGSTALKLILSR